jgi:hypothetical protein
MLSKGESGIGWVTHLAGADNGGSFVLALAGLIF